MAFEIPSNSPYNYGDYFDPDKLTERFKNMFGDEFGDIDFATYDETSEAEFRDEIERAQNFDDWAAEYQSIICRGDGNAAVDHIIQGYKDGTLTKDQAIFFASQVQQQANQNGGGRINGGKRDALQEALGIDYDPIAKGKTRGQMFFEGLGNSILSFFSSL